jgi:hypothetical protein
VNEFFPILLTAEERKLFPECPRFVRWELVAPYEAQAIANHDQTFKRLAERGGLDPSELRAVVEGTSMRELVEKFQSAKTPAEQVLFLFESVEWLEKFVESK